MKKSIVVLAAAAIAAGGAGKVWSLAHENESLARSLDEVISSAGNRHQKPGRQFRSEDLPLVMKALSKEDGAFERAYIWLSSRMPDRLSACLPDMYPSAMIRLNAAAVVGQWGAAARPAVPQLVRLLKDDEADSNAALSLGLIGAGAREAIPALILAVREERPLAATALGMMGPRARAARPTLRAAAQLGPDWLRLESLHALKRIETAAL
jgi:hypothetical protein